MGGDKKARQKRLQAKVLKNRKKIKSKTTVNEITPTQLIEKPEVFSTFADTCAYVKKHVYIIARVRQIGDQARLITLGTGFLAGFSRMLSCAHVFNDPNKGDDAIHQDSDKYVLIQNDEFGNWHRALIELSLNSTLFLYPKIDTAVIYLPDSFYSDGSNEFRSKNDFLKLSTNVHRIGTDVGVLGYPMQNVETDETEGIKVSTVHLRGDRGVINTGQFTDGIVMTEFTLAFNPGNSGGPIFNSDTGEVIALVHGYSSAPIKYIREQIPEALIEDMGGTQYVNSTIRALYSLGVCTINLLELGEQHKLGF